MCVGSSAQCFESLKKMGLEFQFIDREIDLDSAESGESPAEKCLSACQKMVEQQQQKFPEDFIVVEEQIVVLEGEVQPKPGTIERATKQVFKLAGKQHELVTVVCVVNKDYKNHMVSSSKIQMRPYSLMESFAYTAFDDPVGTAGGYCINKAGMALVESIQSDHYMSIFGVPISFIVDCLMAREIELPCFKQQ